jgi:hypothetical protein
MPTEGQNPRRCPRAVPILALVAVTGWWVFHFPCDPARLHRAVPADVTILTEHRELGGRWPTLAGSPLLLAAAGYTNAADAAKSGGPLDPDIRRLLRFTAPHYTLAAWSPHEEAWVAVSWLGWRSQVARFLCMFGILPGFEPVRDGGPLRSWARQDPARPAGRYLSVGIADGVLTVALSNDDETALRLLHRMEYAAAPAPSVQRRLQTPWRASDADRAWVQWISPARGADGFQELAIALAAAGESYTAGGFRLSGMGPHAGLSDRPASLDCWDVPLRLLPDRPAATVLLRTGSARPLGLLDPLLGPTGREVAVAIADTAAESPACFAAVLGNDLGGRILGLRVPSIVVGWRIAPGADVAAATQRVLDSLNAANQLGLMPRTTRLAGRPATLIDSSQAGIVAGMDDRERPAVVVESGWVLAGSCAGSLERLLMEQRPPAFPGRPSWRTGERDGSPVTLFLDAAAVEQSVRHALAVYELSLLVNGKQAARSERRRLSDIRLRLAALAQAGELTIVAAPRGTALEGRFSTGSASSE